MTKKGKLKPNHFTLGLKQARINKKTLTNFLLGEKVVTNYSNSLSLKRNTSSIIINYNEFKNGQSYAATIEQNQRRIKNRNRKLIKLIFEQLIRQCKVLYYGFQLNTAITYQKIQNETLSKCFCIHLCQDNLIFISPQIRLLLSIFADHQNNRSKSNSVCRTIALLYYCNNELTLNQTFATIKILESLKNQNNKLNDTQYIQSMNLSKPIPKIQSHKQIFDHTNNLMHIQRIFQYKKINQQNTMNHYDYLIYIPQSLVCELCRSDIVSSQIGLVEQILWICAKCQNFINSWIKQINLNCERIKKYNNRKVLLIINQANIFYELRFQLCEICYKSGICSKICKNKHFFCQICLESHILNNFHKDNLKCPKYYCGQEIDDYVKFWFIQDVQFKQWADNKQNFFCPQKNCKTILNFYPFQTVEFQNIRFGKNQNQCLQCKSFICNICWREVKGTYDQHQMICNFSKHYHKLLKQFMIINRIFECPKCKFYSESDCLMVLQNIQECQICKTKFCICCKSANLELFYMEKPYHYVCNCFWNFVKKKIIYIVMFLIFLILFSPLTCILNTIHITTQYIQRKAEKIYFTGKNCCYYTFFPLIIIFRILTKFFEYINKIEYLISDGILKILGIYDEYYFNFLE